MWGYEVFRLDISFVFIDLSVKIMNVERLRVLKKTLIFKMFENLKFIEIISLRSGQ